VADNPFQSPTSTDHTLLPIRLRRGRRVLVLMAAIIGATTAWEVLNYSLVRGWEINLFHVRPVVPLTLIWLIWRGRPWARYALAAYCGLIVWSNFDYLALLPRMISKGDVGHIVLLGFFVLGHTLIALLTLFSSALTALGYYRRDERELS